MRLQIKITANAKQDKIEKISENQYKIWVKAPAVENKANKHLINLLAKYFNTSKSNVNILKGEKSKNKIVEIE